MSKVSCDLCGKIFKPDEDIIDINGLARLPIYLEHDFCVDCKKFLVIKYKGDENVRKHRRGDRK